MTKDVFVIELEELIGCKIDGVIREKGHYETYYGLKINDARRKKTLAIWFLRDEEGNGPGSFSIEDYETFENIEEFGN